MKIAIEPKKCIASGQCVMLAPDVFDQDDEGIVELLNEHPEDADHEGVMDSIAVCPAAAIRLAQE